MKKILFAIAFYSMGLYANSLNTLVQNAMEKNYELKSIEKSIKIANENILLAKKLSNPIIVFGINDIHTNDISARDKEPMQAQYIGVSQVIPITNKLEIKKSLEITNKDIIKQKLEDKKLLLKSKIYELFYKTSILKQKLKLLTKQKENLQKLNELQKKLYKTTKIDANRIYNTKIDEQKLTIKINNLKTTIEILKLKLEEITYTKHTKFHIDISPYSVKLPINIDKHPKIKSFELQLKAFREKERFFKASKTSDIKVSASYFSRDDKYQDYVNLSVAIPLSIYNKENIEANKARLSYVRAKDDLENLKIKFKTNQLILQNRLTNSVDNYNILKEQINSLQEELTKNLHIINRFKNNSFQIIKNRNKTLSYELQALNEKEIFLENLAQLKYYEEK